MAGRITLDLSRIAGLDLSSRSRPIRMPGYIPPRIGEESLLRTAVAGVASTGGPNAEAASDILALRDRSKVLSASVLGLPPASSAIGPTAPPSSVLGLPPTSSAVGPTAPPSSVLGLPPASSAVRPTAPPSSFDLTLAYGWGVTTSMLVLTAQLGSGLYLWLPRGQIGIYGTGGFGPTLFATGFSGNVVFTCLFGPAPTFLGGFSLVTGFDVGGPAGIVSLGFALIWSLKWQLEGFCVNIGAGMSANWLKFDVYFEVNATYVKALYH